MAKLELLIRPSLSSSCGVAELRMPEDGADPLRPSGQAAHMPVRSSPQLFLAARRLLARERLLQVGVDALVRIELRAVGWQVVHLDLRAVLGQPVPHQAGAV